MLSHWVSIEADFQERYGLDLTTGLLRRRTGRWLKVRIAGLMSVESRLYYAINPPKGGSK